MGHEAPESIDSFHARLREISGSLPRRMRECADYLSANGDRIAVSTVAELAEGAGVPPSAMMRFCQILGFSGFSEMQRLFRTTFAPGLPNYASRLENLRATGADNPTAILAEFVDAGRNSLESVLKTLDARDLQRAVDGLAAANTIHIMGLRRSYPIAAYMGYAFERMGIPAALHGAPGRIDGFSTLRTGDALIAISYAPYSDETLALMRAAQERDVFIVAMTDTVASPMTRGNVVPLLVSEVDFGAYRSLSGSMALAIAVAVAVGAAAGRKP